MEPHDRLDPLGQLGDVEFAWSWDVGYATARGAARRAEVRLRVSAERDVRSPTGWRWSWEPVKAEYPCPKCGSETEEQRDCPTYKSGFGGWMRCNPGCGDARTWTCTRRGCDWYFATGYAWENPNHAGLMEGRGAVPGWLSESK